MSAMMSEPHVDPILEAALTYAGYGLRVIPIIPGRKHPQLDEWQNVATTDPNIITAWWTGLYRGHGVGILTGPGSGVWVLDVDVAGGKVGRASLADLEDAYGPLPTTVEAITGTGGRHLFFRWDDAHPMSNDQSGKVGPDLDVRGEGGQVVAPPTLHATTAMPYVWRSGRSFAEMEAAPAPGWIYALAEQHDEPTPAPAPVSMRAPLPQVGGEDSAAAAFAAATTWDELLRRDGWTLKRWMGSGEQRWTRPGKTDGCSATVGHKGRDVLHVFTSSVAELTADTTYSRFGYEVAIRYGANTPANRSAFARQLRTEMNRRARDEADAWLREAVSAVGTLTEVAADPPAPVEPEPPPEMDGEAPEIAVGAPTHTWDSVGLVAHVDGHHVAPVPTVLARVGGGALFYPGRVNGLFGESGSGKSWVAMAATVEQIMAGRGVIYVDLEDHPGSVVFRLRSLGASREALLTRLAYVAPELPWGNEAAAYVADLVRTLDVSLVVLDSTGEAMALEGVKSNDDIEVARWFQRLPRFIADLGPAVVLIDHVPKARDVEGRRTEIGSQRKRAAVDGATYEVDAIVPPAKMANGRLRLTCGKDRSGTYARGEIVADVDFLSHLDGAVDLTLRRPAERPEPTSQVRKGVVEFLGEHGAASQRTIRGSVVGKNAAIADAIEQLVADGTVLQSPGRSGGFRYALNGQVLNANVGERSPVPEWSPPVPEPQGRVRSRVVPPVPTPAFRRVGRGPLDDRPQTSEHSSSSSKKESGSPDVDAGMALPTDGSAEGVDAPAPEPEDLDPDGNPWSLL